MHQQKIFRPNKYNAKRQNYNGYNYDSKFEAEYASELDLLLKAGEIKAWDRQFKVEMIAYDEDGNLAMRKNHKVDFRVHHHDGTFELIETKGFDTEDYRERRRLLENLWLPKHPDYTYTVVKRGRSYYPRKRG